MAIKIYNFIFLLLTFASIESKSSFAGPGTKNPEGEAADSTQHVVTIDPVAFSPNGDGVNDQLNIRVNTGEPGWLLNVTILNSGGKVIRKLSNNFPTGSSDLIVWDGLSDDFQKVQPGIYILFDTLFHPSGGYRKMKFACVVTDRA